MRRCQKQAVNIIGMFLSRLELHISLVISSHIEIKFKLKVLLQYKPKPCDPLNNMQMAEMGLQD